MDFSDIGERLPLIIAVVVIVFLWQFLFRRRKPETVYREIAQSLLSEVRLNQALAELFNQQQKPRKLQIVSWLRNKNKLDFLDESLQRTLAEAFGMAEDFNQQIGAAKKYRSAGYLENINVAKLEEPLAKSREGLEQWLSSKTGIKAPPPKYPGLFDRFLGGRG